MKQKNISSTKPKDEAQPIRGYSIIEGMIRQTLDIPINAKENKTFREETRESKRDRSQPENIRRDI